MHRSQAALVGQASSWPSLARRSRGPLVLLVSLAACGPAHEPLAAPPGPPIARLALPRFGAPGEALPASAAASQSPGGALAHYRFRFGDGTAQTDSGVPRLGHAWAQEGVYAVEVEVEDEQGRLARAQGQLTIRVSPPTCGSDAACEPPDSCLAARCIATWGSP